MNILAIDTATEACSAAVFKRGQLYERYQWAPREHNRLILPMVSGLLVEAGLKPTALDAIAFGCGPGSFTGVRIAAGVTQGIAFALDLPVIPISTLAALSMEAMEDSDTVEVAYACIDARMNEVYWGIYERDKDVGVRLLGDELVTPAAMVREVAGKSGIGIGSGWSTYPEALGGQLGIGLGNVLSDRFPKAGFIAKLGALQLKRGGGLPAHQALPVYLRDNVARKPGERP